MKDFIVLIATIILGIALAVLVLGLRSTAQTINDKAVQQITDTFSMELVFRS